jgi:protein ImuA
MTTHLLSRRGDRVRSAVPVLDGMALERARVHEICGPARRTLAMIAARAVPGEILWIRPAWLAERPYPPGVAGFLSPGRLIYAAPKRAEDLLWTAEEALRSGMLALVVADLLGPPGLTPVRRLHLAAETGAAEGRHAPVGLLLTPGDGGAPGVESRWHMAPRHERGVTAWQIDRRRARVAPPQAWRIEAGPGGEIRAG